MKKFYSSFLILSILGCNKLTVNENEAVDIIYELQANDTGFAEIKYGKFYSLSTGASGIQMTKWEISGTGTFTRTESIRKGFIAELYAIHPVSGNWSLKIKAANGTVLKTATPVYITDSSYYYAQALAPVQ
jgi:hypothetical protein